MDLTPKSRAGLVETVRVELQFGGDLLVDQGADGSPSSQMPVSASATLVYDEAHLAHGDRSSVRYYSTIDGQTEVGGRRQSPTLRESRRLILAHVAGHKCQFTAADGVLQRGELDLLNMAASSLVLNVLLPHRKVEIGDTWQLGAAAMQEITGMDSVGLCEVSGVLAEANVHFARCQVAGAVHGVIHGASVEMEVDGVFLFDRQRQQITQLNIALREARTIGPATPGLDAVAKLRVRTEPVADDSRLTPELVARVAGSERAVPQLVETRSEKLGFATQHDDMWYTIGTRADELTIRRVAPEGLVAHGNVTRLLAKPLDSHASLVEFRSDVLRSLGNDAHGIAAEQQWTNQHGCRVMGVIVAGAVEGVDMEWHCYQVAPPIEDEHLHRLALTFTVEKSEVGRLGDDARELVNQIELFPATELQAKR